VCLVQTSAGADAIILGVAGGVVGMVTGGVVSAVRREERWERVPLAGRSSRLRVGPGTAGDSPWR
jgi:hypothetical protein